MVYFSGPCALQCKAEHLGWSGSLLLQTESVLIGDCGRELYMTPLQKNRTIPLHYYDWTLWWPVAGLLSVICVSEVLGEAGAGFAAGQSCAGPQTCST